MVIDLLQPEPCAVYWLRGAALKLVFLAEQTCRNFDSKFSNFSLNFYKENVIKLLKIDFFYFFFIVLKNCES